ncbi:T9SS type A sorting domain-containing protein [Mucilaginibacter sp. PAMB04168]|uniref:T9SS type A sorting domain-containing protein n=1 Tax=Mucilaginibacter sp. PAMB04168 TaxID=3138567 RepID=UPI0031F719D6
MRSKYFYHALGVLCSATIIFFFNVRCLAQSEQRIPVISVNASEDTGQDYSSLLNDDLNNLIPDAWQNNFKYVDVTLRLQKRSTISRLSLYDYKGVFDDNPADIYILNGKTKTLIGKFTGPSYMVMQDMNLPQPMEADAIIIHKYCNSMPQKVFVYGYLTEEAKPEPVEQTPAPVETPADPVKTPPVVLPEPTPAPVEAPADTVKKPPVVLPDPTPAPVEVPIDTVKTPPVVLPAEPAKPAPVVTTPDPVITPAPDPAPKPDPAPADPAAIVKIPIEAKRWYQINSSNDGIADLFDGVVDVPISNTWGKIFNNYDAWYPVADGEKITLSKIKFYDASGTLGDKPFTVSVITSSGKRIQIATFNGDRYNTWVGPYPERNLNGDGQFELDNPITDVKFIVFNCWYMFPTEVEFYGTYQAAHAVTAAPKKDVPFNHYFGVNAFEWDFEDPNKPYEIDESRLKAMKTFTQVRHYLDWQRIEPQQGRFTFNPSHSGGWNYDVLYQRAKAEGIEILADLKTLPDWLLDSYPGDMRDAENVPVKYGQDFTKPTSYIEQARAGFQFAARYGSSTGVDASQLSVNTTQRWYGDGVNTVKQGMDLIKYIECDNERDKWWKGRKAYQTAFEYAANLSAFYDGHKNTMGPGVGVKNADPNMKVVMAGLASPNTDYLRAMVDWCKQNRGYNADGSVNLCWDVINYHLYSNDAKSSQGGNATRGMAPETGETAQVAQGFIAAAHQYAADMPVWVTELGYDVNQGSYLKAIPIGDKTALQTQADWILRSALLYARVGADRIFFYQAYDDNPNSSIQFGSSGLLNRDKSRKPAGDFIYQAQQLLGNYTFKQTVHSNPIVDRYENNGQSAYMLVIPDEKGRSADYTLDLGNADSASIYTPKVGSDQMELKKVQISNGQLALTVTETPQFVIPSSPKAFETGEMLKLATKVANKTDSVQNGIISNTLKVYPNPAINYVDVTFNNKLSGKVDIKVYDARTGRAYRTYSFNKQADEFSQRIDLTGTPYGVCLVEIRQDQAIVTRRVIKLN